MQSLFFWQGEPIFSNPLEKKAEEVMKMYTVYAQKSQPVGIPTAGRDYTLSRSGVGFFTSDRLGEIALFRGAGHLVATLESFVDKPAVALGTET